MMLMMSTAGYSDFNNLMRFSSQIMPKNIQRYVHITKNPLFSVLCGDWPI
jgi:hypothetical protein